MKKKVLTHKETVTTHTIKLTGEDIVSLLRGAKGPAGGDWSGTEVIITNDDQVWVTWTTRETEDTRE